MPTPITTRGQYKRARARLPELTGAELASLTKAIADYEAQVLAVAAWELPEDVPVVLASGKYWQCRNHEQCTQASACMQVERCLHPSFWGILTTWWFVRFYTMQELAYPFYHCENCIGMIDHGCLCQWEGAYAPGSGSMPWWVRLLRKVVRQSK